MCRELKYFIACSCKYFTDCCYYYYYYYYYRFCLKREEITQEDGQNFIIRNFITCTLHQILLG